MIEVERLQKVIADFGYTSRRKAEELIQSGKVSVNGEVITTLGTKVSETDAIVVEGNILKRQDKVYYLLNKPKGYITSVKDELGRKVVTDLIDSKERIYPIGRLDYDTTGLLLLTNDGELANILMHPKNNLEKTYVARVTGKITMEELHMIKKGIKIDDRVCKVNNIKIKKYNKENDSTLVSVTIVEGRNHIVKKLFGSLGHKVVKLNRITYGFLTLDNVPLGDYRNLTLKEIKKLYNYKNT